ncbi:MAG TPA: DUF1573 domain-containing protein [Tenuifilaceae bacterium]|nr:DUF1573 domain-containing protein [Tenuifilaceae bacterium]
MINRVFSFFLIFSFTFALLLSCDNTAKKGIVDSVSNPSDSSGVAKIEFIDDFVDLGTIAHGEVISYTFFFSNKGNAPLIVNDLVADCGCTKVILSKEILNPGETATIELVFDSRGWHGSQFKSVSVKSNAQTPSRTITIKVNVV